MKVTYFQSRKRCTVGIVILSLIVIFSLSGCDLFFNLLGINKNDILIPPVFNIDSGVYKEKPIIRIESLPDCTIRYTLNNTTPTISNGIIYSGPFEISENANIMAVAYKTKTQSSEVSLLSIEIVSSLVPPAIALNENTIDGKPTIIITGMLKDSIIRYTTDGSTPTELNGNIYTEPIIVDSSMTVKAIEYKFSWEASEENQADVQLLDIVDYSTKSVVTRTKATIITKKYTPAKPDLVLPYGYGEYDKKITTGKTFFTCKKGIGGGLLPVKLIASTNEKNLKIWYTMDKNKSPIFCSEEQKIDPGTIINIGSGASKTEITIRAIIVKDNIPDKTPFVLECKLLIYLVNNFGDPYSYDFNGVAAYKNGSYTNEKLRNIAFCDVPDDIVRGDYGYMYQCAEYAIRYCGTNWAKTESLKNYFRNFRCNPYRYLTIDGFGDRPEFSIVKNSNTDNLLPSPGDILAFDKSPSFVYGHTAIVTSVDTDKKKIKGIQQNTKSAILELSYTNEKDIISIANFAGMECLGWVHLIDEKKTDTPPVFEKVDITNSIDYGEKAYFAGTATDDNGINKITLKIKAPISIIAFSADISNKKIVNLSDYYFQVSRESKYATLSGSYLLSITVVDTLNQEKTIDLKTNVKDPPGSLQFSSETYSVGEGSGSVTIAVTRTGGSYGAVGISYATSQDSATATADYTSIGGALSWANGDTGSKSFTVPIVNDSSYEGDERFLVAVSTPTGGATMGTPSRAWVTILDNDPAPSSGSLQFSSETYSVGEGSGSVTIAVTRTGGSYGAVGISYATSQDSATATADYTSIGGALSWANGDTGSKSFTVPIVNDSSYEGDERFLVAVSTPTGGATMGTPSRAWVTILDNDPAPSSGSLQFSSETYSVGEGSGSVTIAVTRTGGSYGAVGISYATSQDSATATADYTSIGGALSWANGDTGSKSFTVPIVNDSSYEGDERFLVAVSTPTGGATMGTPSRAWVTILDNDPAPVDQSPVFHPSSTFMSVKQGSVIYFVGTVTDDRGLRTMTMILDGPPGFILVFNNSPLSGTSASLSNYYFDAGVGKYGWMLGKYDVQLIASDSGGNSTTQHYMVNVVK